MRPQVETCLRHITGFQGRFGDRMEAFWRQAELLYQHCGNMTNGIPVDHIPLWWARCSDQNVPLENPPAAVPAPPVMRATERRSAIPYDPLATVLPSGTPLGV